MKVITVPHPTLRQVAEPLTAAEIIEPEFQAFLDELMATMKEYLGIGIAAPQVDRSLRVIIVNTATGPQTFINPKLLWRSLMTDIDEEGCLSIPGQYGLVKRPKSVIVTYLDRTGKAKRLHAKGLMARVICHEIDHLDGILFTDRMLKESRHVL
ncbi:MAG: peptide deformylase [Patescibacteria group bacterium]